MPRVIGIDPGTVSLDVCGLADGRVYLDLTLSTADALADPDRLIATLTAGGRPDLVAGPSGYGLPLRRAADVTETELRLAFLAGQLIAWQELAAAVLAEGGADRVIECVGRPEAWEQAHTLAARGARVLMFGGCAAGTKVRFDASRIHYDEIDVMGAFHYRGDDVRAALDLLAAGAVRIDPLVTHSLPLTRFAEALDLARSGRAVKVEIRP